MRIAVAGGTGLVGKYTVESLERSGHEVVVLARSRGVDLLSGEGLEDALAGVGSVVDVISTPTLKTEEAREFFGTTSRNLLEAGERAGVEHHVALSIVNADRVEGNGHYAGKRRQEEVVSSGRVPYTILRATQFHEFAGMVAGWTRIGPVSFVPPLRVQPVAASEVGRKLAELAAGEPAVGVRELAGPGLEDFVEMARRTVLARKEKTKVVSMVSTMPFGKGMSGDALLPGPDATLSGVTFDQWLESVGVAGTHPNRGVRTGSVERL